MFDSEIARYALYAAALVLIGILIWNFFKGGKSKRKAVKFAKTNVEEDYEDAVEPYENEDYDEEEYEDEEYEEEDYDEEEYEDEEYEEEDYDEEEYEEDYEEPAEAYEDDGYDEAEAA